MNREANVARKTRPMLPGWHVFLPWEANVFFLGEINVIAPEIQTKWPPFYFDFQLFWTKSLPFCSNGDRIGKPNALGKPNGELPLKFRTRWVFQPPLHYIFNKENIPVLVFSIKVGN